MHELESRLYYYVMAHLSLAQELVRINHQMLQSLRQQKLDLFTRQLNNFEQVNQQLTVYYKNIEDLALQIASNKTEEISRVIKAWKNEIGEIENLLISNNQIILDLARNEKAQIQSEIAKNFNNRKKLSGYNLSSVKR